MSNGFGFVNNGEMMKNELNKSHEVEPSFNCNEAISHTVPGDY